MIAISTKNRNPRCKFCNSLKTVKRGTRSTKNGSRQMYQCNACKRRFSLFKTAGSHGYVSMIAGIALKAAKPNHQRHAMIQRFLLTLDKSTIAVEVPVFLTDAETRKILGKKGGLLGHIDFLQVFKDRVAILDYKPEPVNKKDVVKQLMLYAIALSQRTGIHLKHIDCGWFHEKKACRFAALNGYHALKKRLKI